VCQEVLGNQKNECDVTFHLGLGTQSMVTVWVLLSKTKFRARLIECSLSYPRKYEGIKEVVIPFDISAEFVPQRAFVERSKLLALLPHKTCTRDLGMI
jgi:hypothetical protein